MHRRHPKINLSNKIVKLFDTSTHKTLDAMVAAARLAAGLSGLRNRNTRVTNKTQLRVVKGSIETDPIILDDDDDEKNRILASQGVDEEDANVSRRHCQCPAGSRVTLPLAIGV